MAHNGFDLLSAAHQEMINQGFQPDFPPDATRQLEALESQAALASSAGVRDLRARLWSSIDNDTSRDLDQAEFVERVSGGIRVFIAIADVDTDVPIGLPIDIHAVAQATSIHGGVRTFPMLPEKLSTDLTSLNQGADRLAVVVEMLVSPRAQLLPVESAAHWCATRRIWPPAADRRMPMRRLDPRVTTVANRIQASDDLRVSLSAAAEMAFLFPSRFAHLFKQQVGLPFSGTCCGAS